MIRSAVVSQLSAWGKRIELRSIDSRGGCRHMSNLRKLRPLRTHLEARCRIMIGFAINTNQSLKQTGRDGCAR